MPIVVTYYLDVFAVNPSGLDAIQIINGRRIESTCYSKAYEKAVNILKANNFIISNIFLVLTEEKF